MRCPSLLFKEIANQGVICHDSMCAGYEYFKPVSESLYITNYNIQH